MIWFDSVGAFSNKISLRHIVSFLLVIPCFLISSILMTSCTTNKKTVSVNNDKVLLTERSAGWLKYKVYLLPATEMSRKGANNMMLSIQVINMQDNTSPLRKICADLDQYNTYYEYLLNRCKEDLLLYWKGEILYPVSYSFENNYNAFPFETINVGYKYDLNKKRNKRMKDLKLAYTDRVFAQDTITFYLNNKK